ncbi:MAG: hypothetical protein U0V72_07365 [Cytophagales bacterium]
MIQTLPTYIELSASLNSELIHETLVQTESDFGRFGISLDLISTLPLQYDTVHQKLSNFLNAYMGADYPKLISVLYQIDISDKDINDCENAFPNYNYAQVLAHSILYREFKKIYFRRYYKNIE